MFAHLILTSTICACLEKQITVVTTKFTLLGQLSFYYFQGINRIGGVLHILGWIVNLFVSCLAGQRLINAVRHDTSFVERFSKIVCTEWYHS
jgi:hypothetical protein